MLSKFFGNRGEKPQQQPTPQAQSSRNSDQQVEQQRTLAQLSKKVAEANERIDKLYSKIEKQETKIKELISKGKKTEAKRQLITFKMNQEELVKAENIVTILEKAKIQLESSLETSSMVTILRDVNQVQTTINASRDVIEDVLMERKELEQDEKEMGALIAELANNGCESEEIDELYAKFEEDLLGKKITDINSNPVNAEISVRKKPEQIRKQPVIEDALEEVLQQAAQYS